MLIKEYIKKIIETEVSKHAIERLIDRLTNENKNFLRVGYEISVGKYKEVGTFKISSIIKDEILYRYNEISKTTLPLDKSIGVILYKFFLNVNNITLYDYIDIVTIKNKKLVLMDDVTESNGDEFILIVRDNNIVTVQFSKSYVSNKQQKHSVDEYIDYNTFEKKYINKQKGEVSVSNKIKNKIISDIKDEILKDDGIMLLEPESVLDNLIEDVIVKYLDTLNIPQKTYDYIDNEIKDFVLQIKKEQGLTESKPYKDIIVKENYIVRRFSKTINENELKWHMDNEKRKVIPLFENDWKFQFENHLPKPLNESFSIEKHQFHRLIKGNNDLYLIILKENDAKLVGKTFKNPKTRWLYQVKNQINNNLIVNVFSPTGKKSGIKKIDITDIENFKEIDFQEKLQVNQKNYFTNLSNLPIISKDVLNGTVYKTITDENFTKKAEELVKKHLKEQNIDYSIFSTSTDSVYIELINFPVKIRISNHTKYTKDLKYPTFNYYDKYSDEINDIDIVNNKSLMFFLENF